MPKVSIVVPVYNSARFLPQCLDSLLGQTWEELEILCVNDGSTDNSLEILEAYASRDKRVRVFTKKNEGKGAAPARNLGLAQATGKYVQILDSDDFFEPDMVEELVRKAERTAADLVIYRADHFDHMLQKVTQEYLHIELQYVPGKDPFNYRDCPEHIFQIGDLIAWNKLFRMDFLERHGLRFEPLPISDDQYVSVLSLVLADRITCVDRAFLHYRFHTGQSQCDSRTRHPEAAYSACYSIVSRMREAGIYETVKRSYLNMAVRLMREYFDIMTEPGTVRFLYEKYKKEVFPALEAEGLPSGYFYDWRLGEWYTLVCSHSLEEILFMAARGYGNGMTTAILRFQAPSGEIPQGSRIVLAGRGIAGRYWYAQFLLSGCCEVVCWVADEAEIPPGLEYDMVVVAK